MKAYRSKPLQSQEDREIDLQRQRDTFGYTLRELRDNRALKSTINASATNYHNLLKCYRRQLGNWKREAS